MTKNRTKLARERAGLSIGQACKILGLERDYLIGIEERDDDFEQMHPSVHRTILDRYQVNPEWLSGDREQHDYAALDAINGADRLIHHDREIIAEFMAAMPRGKNKTLAEIAAEKSKP
jgi:hypothetical protein